MSLVSLLADAAFAVAYMSSLQSCYVHGVSVSTYLAQRQLAPARSPLGNSQIGVAVLNALLIVLPIPIAISGRPFFCG